MPPPHMLFPGWAGAAAGEAAPSGRRSSENGLVCKPEAQHASSTCDLLTQLPSSQPTQATLQQSTHSAFRPPSPPQEIKA